MKFSDLKKADKIILTAVILTGCLILLLCIIIGKEGSYAKVTIDGQLYGNYPLDVEGEFDINGSNTLMIKDGYAYMLEADCPDGLCMKMGKINRNGQSIICLPNKIVIEISSR
jgi:hypothetical protein